MTASQEPDAGDLILVVDDNPEDRAAVILYLSEAGSLQDLRFRFLEARNGLEGLAAWHAETPDCILLDYRLPDMDGLEFLARLRGAGGDVPLPVVMLTGSGDHGLPAAALRAGAQEYLPKRFMQPEMLLRAVQSARDRFRLMAGRRGAEAALARSEEMLRLSQEAGQIACYEHDYQTDVIRWAAASQTFFGFPAASATMPAEIWAGVRHPDDVTRIQAERSAAFARQDAVSVYSYRIRRPDTDAVRRIEVRFAIGYDAAGKPLRSNAAVIDVTELARTNDELEERVRSRTADMEEEGRRRLEAEAKLDQARRTGRISHLTGEAALASSRAETKAGQADLLASVVALSSLRAESEAVHLASEAALASSRAETKLTLDDLVASAVALALAQEETRAGQTDLMASEVANKALALANGLLVTSEAALESLVDKRTRALMREMADRRLAEEALRQGEKLQAIGHLTGGIAHDFNNILQIIFSGTSLLRRSGVTEERRSALLDRIEHAASRASDLTGRLLAFARRQVLQPRAFDLNLRLADMSVLLQPALGSHIKIETDFAPDLWPIIADPSQLEVAVLNLAVNARDAMMPEGGVFTIRTGNATLAKTLEREAGDYVCLTVSDSGPGMSPDVMSHAFEPFYTTKAPGKGTGLGLAQVYGFAKQSGGDVSIESAQGNGTAIVLHFMRPTEAAIAAAAPRTEDAHPPRVARQAVGHTILVVDDDMDLAGLTASMLEDTGYTVMRAANADDALAVLSAGDKVDAVFSDVIMPGTMNGVDLAVTLRVRYPHVAVLLATGYSQLLAEWNGPTEVEVLKKPYRLNDLVAALDRSFASVAPEPA